jgi:hypothetical protein
MTKTEKILKIVNEMETTHQGFFTRSGKDMYIYFHNWSIARTVQDQLGLYGRDVQPDRLSGNLVMHLENVYTK